MRNGTTNWKKQVNDRIEERSIKPGGKRVGHFETYWYDRLTEAAKQDDEKIYQAELNDYYQAVNARKKGPELKT